jgi:predicted secreted protein
LLSGLALPSLLLADSDRNYDQINFQASASERVSNDWMTVVLAAQGESRDPAALADKINRTMKWALDIAGGNTLIKVKTAAFINTNGNIR